MVCMVNLLSCNNRCMVIRIIKVVGMTNQINDQVNERDDVQPADQ